MRLEVRFSTTLRHTLKSQSPKKGSLTRSRSSRATLSVKMDHSDLDLMISIQIRDLEISH